MESAMAPIGSNKRRKRTISPESPHTINSLPDVILVGVAKYLSRPSRALFAVAMTPTSSTREQPSRLPTTTSRSILRASLDIHEDDDTDEPWEVLDFIEFEAKSLVTHHKKAYPCGNEEYYYYESKETHYGEIGNAFVKKLNDHDVGSILMLVDSVQPIKTLKLAGCVNITGAGLEPLRGSITLKRIDLSLVGPHESPVIKPEPMLSESEVIPILDSIIDANGSSLEYLLLPKVWRQKKTSALDQFLQRYNHYMENRCIGCSGCRMLCQDTDAGGRKPWVIQNRNDFPYMIDRHSFSMTCMGYSPNNGETFFMKRWGMQRFTCHKCFEHTCFVCQHGSSEVGGGHYVAHNQCVKCEKSFCAECDSDRRCHRCHDYLCTDCRRGEDGELSKCKICNEKICDDCIQICTGCNKSGCSGYGCLSFNQCDGKHCGKFHCVDCFGGKEYDVEYCVHCEKEFCHDCRYSTCRKDWAKACPTCMDKINVFIPIHNRSAYLFYSESVRSKVEAANLLYLGWGVGQIMMKQFKALSYGKRAHWDEKAVDDRKRYEEEMVAFEKMHGSVLCQTPLSMYANSVRSNVKAVNPTAKSERIYKICCDQFEALPREEVAYWEQQSTTYTLT